MHRSFWNPNDPERFLKIHQSVQYQAEYMLQISIELICFLL